MFHDILRLAARLTVGGYVAAHGAQKLFGAFGGHGLEGTGGFFESVGLRPGKPMAAAAGTSELAGGVLTATGFAHPIGPLAIASTMAVASGTVHRDQGVFASDNGPELPLANLAASVALASTDPGRVSLDRALGTSPPAGIATAIAGAGVVAAAGLIAYAASATAEQHEHEQKGDQGASEEEVEYEERQSA